MKYISYDALAITHFCAFDEALRAAQRAVESNPRFIMPVLYVLAALVRLGRCEEIPFAAQRALALDPTFTVKKYKVEYGHQAEIYTLFAEAWIEAGLPRD